VSITVRFMFVFFFQAEDGIRDRNVTGVQTCALPICSTQAVSILNSQESNVFIMLSSNIGSVNKKNSRLIPVRNQTGVSYAPENQIGRASCRERVMKLAGAG